METWPDAAYTPFRCAKGSTWEGGVRVPMVIAWPGMIDGGQVSDGIFDFNDILPTVLEMAGASDAVPTDRFIDGMVVSGDAAAIKAKLATHFAAGATHVCIQPVHAKGDIAARDAMLAALADS